MYICTYIWMHVFRRTDLTLFAGSLCCSSQCSYIFSLFCFPCFIWNFNWLIDDDWTYLTRDIFCDHCNKMSVIKGYRHTFWEHLSLNSEWSLDGEKRWRWPKIAWVILFQIIFLSFHFNQHQLFFASTWWSKTNNLDFGLDSWKKMMFC